MLSDLFKSRPKPLHFPPEILLKNIIRSSSESFCNHISLINNNYAQLTIEIVGNYDIHISFIIPTKCPIMVLSGYKRQYGDSRVICVENHVPFYLFLCDYYFFLSLSLFPFYFPNSLSLYYPLT